MAPFWAPVMNPFECSRFVVFAVQLTYAPWLPAPEAQLATRSRMVQPLLKSVSDYQTKQFFDRLQQEAAARSDSSGPQAES